MAIQMIAPMVPFAILLCIPAIQCRSWLRFIYALFGGWILSLLDKPEFLIQYPYVSFTTLFIPGVDGLNPSHSPDQLYLGITLLIFLGWVNLALAFPYRHTRFLGCNYWLRLILGTIFQMVGFFLEPYDTLHDIGWFGIIAALIWMISQGLNFAFVYGVAPSPRIAPAKKSA